jgi:hypothetical protein
MKPAPIGLCSVYAILVLAAPASVLAAADDSELRTTIPGLGAVYKVSGLPSVYLVSEQYYPAINGHTNPAVTARRLGPFLPPGYHQPIFFSTQTGEVLLAALNTNHNCFLNGRLFRVDAGRRQFYVTPSTPLGTNVFSAEAALQLGKRAFMPESQRESLYPVRDLSPGSWGSEVAAFANRVLEGRGAGGRGVVVDLEPLLKARMENVPPEMFPLSRFDLRSRLSLWNMHDPTIKPQGTNLQVTFNLHFSYQRGATVKGTVLLDQKLNVLSIALGEPEK